MVPACYPSKISSTTGLREAVVFALPSVTGLVRWTDYIPVKLVASADAALEGRTDAGGFIPMDMRCTTKRRRKGFVCRAQRLDRTQLVGVDFGI